jgi:uncharacterized protein
VRVVLDTNVMLSGFFFGGVPGRILQAWRDGHVKLVISPSILAEYCEAGSELEGRYGGSDFEAFAALLVLHSELVDAPATLDEQVCSDPDDDKFLSCARVARVDTVVSGDTALLRTSGWSGIEVLRPRSFAEEYL